MESKRDIIHRNNIEQVELWKEIKGDVNRNNMEEMNLQREIKGEMHRNKIKYIEN
jgi:hypothetical protein